MHAVFQAYANEQARMQRADSTRRNFLKVAERFTNYCDNHGLDPVTCKPWQIEEFLGSMELAPSSQRMYFQNLHAAYNFAEWREMIEKIPTRGVRLPKVPDREPEILSTAELREIRQRAWTPREELLFHLFAFTGCRHEEVRLLTWNDISLPDRTMKVLGKGQKLRLVPIHPTLAGVLKQQDVMPGRSLLHGPRGGPLSKVRMYELLHRIAPSIGGYHTFRRTVASSLAKNRAWPDAIDRILGHGPRDLRQRYYTGVTSEDLYNAILRLYADDPL